VCLICLGGFVHCSGVALIRSDDFSEQSYMDEDDYTTFITTEEDTHSDVYHNFQPITHHMDNDMMRFRAIVIKY